MMTPHSMTINTNLLIGVAGGRASALVLPEKLKGNIKRSVEEYSFGMGAKTLTGIAFKYLNMALSTSCPFC